MQPGAAFAATVAEAWPAPGLDGAPAAYPVAVGRAAAAHGIAAADAALAYLHAFSANLVSAGVRLIPIGQTDGQRALAALEPVCAPWPRRRGPTATLDDHRLRFTHRRSADARLDERRTRRSAPACSAPEEYKRHDLPPRPPARRHRRPGRLRQDHADRGALPASARPRLAGGDHQRHLHPRGRRVPDARAGAAAGADRGVETGGCPHTAIREDASINLAAIADLRAKFPDLELVLIESGGDNLSATFSPELADLTLYVIDVSAGDKIPRKGGPGSPSRTC
jgi:hypothetical protein